MSDTQAGIDSLILLQRQLLEHEGFRSAAYQDSLGYWSIGIGRMIDSRRGGGITSDEAIYLLNNDIRKVKQQLDTAMSWWRGLDPVRQRVLMDMCFNLGLDGLLDFKNTLRAVSKQDWVDAADGMLASLWAQQTGRRAHRLAQMMRTGVQI